ncbi:penicillin-binding transpeptidase domain-containing protein [Lentibacillus lipolyticus]|nr:penicillin-binding transpeptidase domain-containing protein [Lentibacillus lipolyticus]
MRKSALFLFILLLVIVTACTDDEITPQERFDTYVNHWNEQEFSKMYEMLTANAAETYPTKEYVDRYKKIYSDLEISDVKVSYEKLSDEEMDKAMEKGTAQFPFTVEMNSIAGPITFDYKATLIKEGKEEDKENWYVKWDPGFIFPQIKDGSDIGLQTTEPKRGEILDRNRMPLAINAIVHEIGIIPGNLGDHPEKTIQRIANLLDISVKTINSKLDQGWVGPNMHVPLKKVRKNQESLVTQLQEIDAVSTQDATARAYPLGKAAAHLTGYIGNITAEEIKEMDSDSYDAHDMIGKRGLELLYEDRLKGQEGVTITAVNKNGDETVIAEKPVENGENIVTTIDADVQETIYNTYEGDAGTAAAIHPKTGETLALVSSPAFDPNKRIFGISQTEYEELQNDPQRPLVNRFRATFSPGSAMKPITAAVGLQSGSIVPGEGVEINGLTWSNGENWGDYKVRRVSESNGPVDVTDALVRSDNIYFAMKAVDMGSEQFTDGLKQFGFGEELPFPYGIETSSISSNGSIDDEVLLADTAYGQGQIQISPLHLALSYTPFLNDGSMLKPTLIADTEKNQVWKKDLLTSEQATVVRDALRDVVASPKGTAQGAQDANFPISGKTGTAELKQTSDEDGAENGWFVGYPADEQNILIAMMIENTQDKGGSGYTVNKVTDILKTVH